jgi:uncharacterized protein YndB with AHSA1/START domain
MIRVKRTGLAGTLAAFWIILAAIAAYNFAVRPWFLHWGTTPAERTKPLLGDDAWIGGVVTGTRAVTIKAPPEKVWPWIAQIGQDRAGFYSHTWLENLLLADIHNTYRIRPEWQELKAKDIIRSVKPGFLFGLVKEKGGYTGWKVSFVAPGQAMTLRNWGTFALEPTDAGGTRFLARSRAEKLPGVAGRLLGFWALDAAHFIMEKRMMTEIRRLAEGRPGPPWWLRALATAGFAAAVVGSTLLIGSKKRRREFWLLLPLFTAVIILQQTSDLGAALTGFTALALTIIGFLYFGKRWWVYFGFLWIYACAVLFLAADAWIVFGLVFLAAFAALFGVARKGMSSR